MGTTFKDRGQRAAGNLLSYKECQDFFRTKFDISGHIAPYAENLIADAEKDLDKPYPMLNASVYMQFARNGNRSNYEAANFGRRDMLQRFFFAELAEGKGRFTDRVIDGLWHIMEESTWILPAHNATNGKYPGTPLIDAFFTAEEGDDVKHIDLFSAATGAQMALLWFYSAELLDGEVPIVRTRLLSQLKQRILHPFYTYDHDWWMGTKGNTLNNWTPWIISNVLFIIALCEDDEEKRAFGVQKSMDILDRFIAPYPDDGGCDEGPGYWGVAGASYFDCMELLADMSGGKIDALTDPLMRRMCEYIMNVSIRPNLYINFSDAAAHLKQNARTIARMGRRTGSDRLYAFAASLPCAENRISVVSNAVYRILADFVEPIPKADTFVPAEHTFFHVLQVAVSRDPENEMLFALKGGTNGESHNHNDVGQIILFDHGEPVIMDAGVETYCRDTFSDRRYTLWAMRGRYHNIAEFGGVEQKPGGNYHADTVSYDEATGELALELKNAYPTEAGIVSYVRRGILDGHTVRLTDTVSLDAEKEACFRYLTVDEPTVEGNTVRFATGHVMTFDPALQAVIDYVEPDKGGKLAREWKRDKFWRITLKADAVKDASFETTIQRA